MSRRGSSGGGQSSLGYLFGSENENQPRPSPTTTQVAYAPPYGIDTAAENTPSDEKPKINIAVSTNNQRSQGQNSGNFITDRPTTKVKSVPGGDSSLGYLFGNK